MDRHESRSLGLAKLFLSYNPAGKEPPWATVNFLKFFDRGFPKLEYHETPPPFMGLGLGNTFHALPSTCQWLDSLFGDLARS